ncbi:MAG: AsnC family transcriptional regulator [Thaumarchaeota archaeon]|nr:AsnC family transcriptional regulator [Nitrososphaerota archaeon]
MPIKLDNIDIALLELLIQDGRKSFNQLAREIKTSAPTVKARYDRLVSAGLIRAVSVDLDVGKLEAKTGKRLEHLRGNVVKRHNVKIGKGMIINLSCDYCKGQVSGKPHILKFGTLERFFCCTSCKSLYEEKYRSRINSLK